MAPTPGTLTVMLDVAWRVTLVLAVAWGATRLLGRRPAALRHAVWASALLVALAVPMLAGVLPSWRIAVLPASGVSAIVPSAPNVPPSRPLPPPRITRVAPEATARETLTSSGLAVACGQPADRRLAGPVHRRLAGSVVGKRRGRDHRPVFRQHRVGALADARCRTRVGPALA